MSKAVQQEVNKLFEATKDLQTLEEIKPHCQAFNNWLEQNTSYNVNSLGTVLSRVGFYKLFKSIPLQQGLNADYVQKQDGSHELKHYAVLLCGLKDEDWLERNQSTRVSDRLTVTDEDGNAGVEIDPDKYLEVTGELLASENPHELAVGLIAATGRRPHEILARGKFTPVEGESYQVMFEGQGKKRGENPVFKISTLFPASYIIERLNHLRHDASIQELLKQASSEFPRDVSAQNKAIEDKRGNSLRRVVQEHFGSKDNLPPILNFRHGQEQNDCKALRAACACLVTERDCAGSVGAKMLFYGKFLGHVTPGQKPSDKDLSHLVTSLGYADYYVNKPVSFPSLPETNQTVSMANTPDKHQLTNVRVNISDLDIIRQFQTQLELPNQQSVVTKLIESFNQASAISNQLEQAQNKISQLEAQVKQLEESNNLLQQENNQLKQDKAAMESTKQQSQSITLNLIDLESWIKNKVTEIVSKLIDGEGKITPAATAAVPVNVEPIKEDWQSKPDAEVWGTKAPGAAIEKIRRSFVAICEYNDTIATGDGDRLAITNQALRDLSGCNGLLVRDWIEEHKDEVISHNSKYGMENKKDPSNPASYANKGKDTNKILLLINEEFLSGEGFRKAKSE